MIRTANERQHAARLAILLALFSALGPFTVDTFFPSMRTISVRFGVSLWQTQQLLTVYMLPYACMSLVHGSLSDALGRRRVILVALALYVLASIGCTVAPSFAFLLTCRFLQGLVGGAGQIVGRAIVRDRYSGAEAQRMMSIISMIFSAGPALAPIIGGWLQVSLGWRSVFGFMVLYGLALGWAAYYYLPETHPPSQRSRLHIVPILRSTAEVMSHVEFLRLALASGLCFVALHIYLGTSPAIILDHWKLDETQFYVLTIPIIGGFTIGAWLSGRFAGTPRARWQAAAGFLILLVTTVLMVLLQSLLNPPPIYLQQLDLVVMALGLQLMYPIVTLKILDLFPQSRGAAASAQSFVSLILGALAMGLFAPLLVESMLHIAWAALAVATLAWLLWRQSAAHRQRAIALHPPG